VCKHAAVSVSKRQPNSHTAAATHTAESALRRRRLLQSAAAAVAVAVVLSLAVFAAPAAGDWTALGLAAPEGERWAGLQQPAASLRLLICVHIGWYAAATHAPALCITSARMFKPQALLSRKRVCFDGSRTPSNAPTTAQHSTAHRPLRALLLPVGALAHFQAEKRSFPRAGAAIPGVMGGGGKPIACY
jgi:hypothetical protein